MIEELKDLGLTHYESKAFRILLKEKLNLSDLSKKSGVPFGKIYSVVKSLKEKGLVEETNSRPKLIYVENASDVISKLIKEKQNMQTAIIEKIKELATEIDKSKGKTTKFFQIGTTVQDNREIQLRSFIEAEKEVLQILNIHHKPKSNRESKTLWEKEIEKAVKRGVVFKAIYPKNVVLPKILQAVHKKNPDKFQIKKFDTNFTRCDVIDGKKVLIKLVHQDAIQYGGVLFIENERLAKNLIKIFNEMWSQAD